MEMLESGKFWLPGGMRRGLQPATSRKARVQDSESARV